MTSRSRVRGVRSLVAGALASAFSWASAAHAQQPAPSQPSPADAAKPDDAAAKKEEAQKHFKAALALFDDEAWDPALVEFQRSRAIYPTRAATKNAAYCLRKLKRYDEALDTFEEVLKFPGLSVDDVARVNKEIAELRSLVGAITVQGAEAGATIVIDGRTRGTAPAATALRVPVGTHIVRVYKGGYEAFETRVEVAGGQSVAVNAKLTMLAQSGRLKVTEGKGRTLEVVVDNVVVGKTPWEGALAPGDHTVALRGEGDLGTQPALAFIELNQITPLTLSAEALNSTILVEPTPAGASIAIDGVRVGRGRWEGRLKAGPHRVEVGAEGFLPQTRAIELKAGKKESVGIELERDPSSPVWAGERGHFFVEIDGDFGLAPTLGGSVAGCASPCTKGLGLGFVAVGRGGYRFRSGVMLAVDAGYLLVNQRVSGRKTSVKPIGLADNPGTADDALTLRGVALGGSLGLRLGSKVPFTLRLGTGVLLGTVVDHRTGKFSTVARDQKPAKPYDVDLTEPVSSVSLYLAPEVRVGLRLGSRFELSAGLESRVIISPSQPRWSPDQKQVTTAGDGIAKFADDPLIAKVLVVVAPGIAGRVEF